MAKKFVWQKQKRETVKVRNSGKGRNEVKLKLGLAAVDDEAFLCDHSKEDNWLGVPVGGSWDYGRLKG